MSTIIMSRCWPLQMPPTPKAVLLSLADNANDHGECWPSLTTICERTCLGRTAVINAIKWLEEAGLLLADRSNGRHSRYAITPEQYGNELFKTGKPVREANQSARRTSPANVPNQSARRTEPVREADTNRKEPSRTVTKSKAPAAPVVHLPEWLDQEAWSGFVESRKKNPMTARAASLLIRELEKLGAQGHDPTEVLDQSTRNGWRDVFPIKPKREESTHANPGRLSAAERVLAHARAGELADGERADPEPNGRPYLVGSHG